MTHPPLLIEIGCEEIPARMIRPASAELARRVCRILEQSGLGHGESTAWGGPRRLAVRVEQVIARQSDRDELVLGPPAKVAFSEDGQPTPAALGFARKQGVDPGELSRQTTDRGEYVGFRRQVEGKSVGAVLAQKLPAAVESMSFPKTMRWASGDWRWVRPVHWLLARHGEDLLPVELFGVAASGSSVGHRFLGAAAVPVAHPDRYAAALEEAHVIADPAERRRRLTAAIHAAAAALGGHIVEDPGLLEEVADLVEWPGVVGGEFGSRYLELPRELLVTTLRHHQKCFSVQSADGRLLAGFVAVANTDRDPAGHIRHGNEWVIGGRLEDARFFWNEDLERPLGERSADLERVVFHAKLGSYADKARRMADLAGTLAERVGLDERSRADCRRAAELSKNDLVTGTVGEFPELQGRVGGLLLEAEGQTDRLARAVYEHYQPAGPEDDVPTTGAGAIVGVADKLDSIAGFIAAGEVPTGSRDPFGLRRAANGLFRTVLEHGWPISLNELAALAGGEEALGTFLGERLQHFLRETGATVNEVRAVSCAAGFGDRPLPDVLDRVRAIGAVRDREDFAHLVELTKRISNVTDKAGEAVEGARQAGWSPDPPAYEDFSDPKTTGQKLREMIHSVDTEIAERAREKHYNAVVDLLADFVEPVDRFFEDVLVIDAERRNETFHRREMLLRLKRILTRYFDIRELAGQAERRPS